MESRTGSRLSLAVALLVALGWATGVQAVNFGNMMNPGNWFGSGDRYRHDRAYGYGAPAYGYGAPGYSYGAPYANPQYAPHGYAQPPATPAYGTSAPAAPAPAKEKDSEERIKALEQRIQELEAAQRPAPTPSAPPPSTGGYSGTPLPMQSLPRTQPVTPPPQPRTPSGGHTFRPLGQQ